MKTLRDLAWIGLALSLSTTASASEQKLTQECEEALALSALPSELREGASVYVLGTNGYEKTVEGDGAYTCVVGRNHPLSIVPQCVSKTGADQIIPAILRNGELAARGASPGELRQDFQAKAQSGEYAPAKAPGINYMMSAYNYIYTPQTERIAHIPAHVMFFAPNVKGEDLGAGSQKASLENKGVPLLFEEGVHGYLITFVETAADPSAVKQACAGQIKDGPPTLARD